MEFVVVLRVKNGQKNETQSPCDGEKDRPNGTGLVKSAFVTGKLTGMPKPALG